MSLGRITWRPVHLLALLLIVFSILNTSLFLYSNHRRVQLANSSHIFDIVTSGLGLTDLCISTEARYTRHPTVSDPVVPFMDHPGAMEHFPSGSFWTPPGLFPELRDF